MQISFAAKSPFGMETTCGATTSTRSLLSIQLLASQQEADWLQDAEIIQNHFIILKFQFFSGKARSDPKGGDSLEEKKLIASDTPLSWPLNTHSLSRVPALSRAERPVWEEGRAAPIPLTRAQRGLLIDASVTPLKCHIRSSREVACFSGTVLCFLSLPE